MKLVVTTLVLIVMVGSAAKIGRAPNIEAVPIIGNDNLKGPLLPPSPSSLDQQVITSIPDMRTVAGSAGKNIVFAEDGSNVAVIYSLDSGDPWNFMKVYIAYSTDGGNTWPSSYQYGPLSTFYGRRAYSGLDAKQDWPQTDLVLHYAWHQALRISDAYDSSPAFYSQEMGYPLGLTTLQRLPNSGARDVWMPCVGVKDSFVIITADNNDQFQHTKDCYIWRSTDYGVTWDTGRVFFPGPDDWMAGPHFRFGSNGYMFFLWNRAAPGTEDRYWTYYCESFNYGETWTEPQLIWQNDPPYPITMNDVKSWWYTYDCEVVRDTPVAAVKFSTANLEYGEIWVYRPDSGTAGNWHFKGTKLVGGDSIAPQTYACYPTLAADDSGNTFIGFQAFYIVPPDTLSRPDLGLFARPAIQDTWYDWARITTNGGEITERFLELAHNAPLFANGESTTVGMIFTTADSFPFAGNLYYHHFNCTNPPIPPPDEIAENNKQTLTRFEVTATPNPFRNSVKFSCLSQSAGCFKHIELAIYDITGKLVKEIRYALSRNSKNELIWDGRNQAGALVNAGVYFYCLRQSAGCFKHKGKLIFTQ